MAPFKLTAQQYHEIWKERIKKEYRVNVQMTADHSTMNRGMAAVAEVDTTGAPGVPTEDNVSILSKLLKASRQEVEPKVEGSTIDAGLLTTSR